jgi:hypothetical protein
VIPRVAVIATLIACGGGSSNVPAPTEPTGNTAPSLPPDAATTDPAVVESCAAAMAVMHQDPEDLRAAMADVVLSCSQACDLGSSPSCDHLEDFMRTTCGAVIGICDGLCSGEPKSPSLKRTSCAHDSTP